MPTASLPADLSVEGTGPGSCAERRHRIGQCTPALLGLGSELLADANAQSHAGRGEEIPAVNPAQIDCASGSMCGELAGLLECRRETQSPGEIVGGAEWQNGQRKAGAHQTLNRGVQG